MTYYDLLCFRCGKAFALIDEHSGPKDPTGSFPVLTRIPGVFCSYGCWTGETSAG